MAARVLGSLHQRLFVVALWLAMGAAACASNLSADLDVTTDTDASPTSNGVSNTNSTLGSTKVGDGNAAVDANGTSLGASPTPSPTPSQTVGSGSGSNGVSLPLQPVHQVTASQSTPGINLMPRLALNECLDVKNGQPSVNLPMQMYTCDGSGTAQQWAYTEGQLRIDGTWCLDISSTDPNLATNTIVNTCDNEGSRLGQFWNFVDGMMQVAGTNFCMITPDANATIEATMRLGPCNPNDSEQQWAVGDNTSQGIVGVSISTDADSTKCLDIYASNPAANATVDIYTCNGSGAQQWVWQGRALQALTNCLQANNGTVEMEPCDATNPQQQWETDKGRIKLFGTTQCLDLSRGLTADASPLAISSCSTAVTQKWTWGNSMSQ